jgi:alpha-ribazole phosphatase
MKLVPTTTTIDLMRHGEPVGGKRYRGHRDDPLSEKGWMQMRGAVGEHRPWDAVVSSTLRRCSEFAAEVAGRCAIPLELEPRLMEIRLGEWEGRSRDELHAQEPGVVRRFWTDPIGCPPPGAERLADFRDRVVAAWDELLQRHAGRHVLVVGHAGMIRMVVRHVLDMPLERFFRVQVPTAGITRIQVEGVGEQAFPRLLFHAAALDPAVSPTIE